MGMYYIIRSKDISSNGIVASLKEQLPDNDTFNAMTSFFLSQKNTTNVKKYPKLYKIIRSDQSFDFFNEDSCCTLSNSRNEI